MKKIFFFGCLLVVLCGAASSCVSSIVNEDEIKPPTPPVSNDKLLFLRLHLLDARYNSALNWTNFNDIGYIIENEQGEAIYANKKIEINESGTTDVLLTDSIHTDSENGKGYAYAPYSASLSGSVLTGTLSNIQDQSVKSDKTMDPALKNNLKLRTKQAAFKFDQGSCQFNLENIFSVIQVTVEEDAASILPFRSSIKSATLYVADENDITKSINSFALAGAYSIDLKISDATPIFSTSSHSITANLTSTGVELQINQKPVIYFVVNTFTLKANERLAVRVVTSREDVFYSSYDISPARNAMYAVKAVATAENTYVESINAKYLNAYSNCYVISQNGKYVIPADKTIKNQVLAGAKVEWLWASKEGGRTLFDISELMDPSSIKYEDNLIYFQIGSSDPFSTMKKGNVVLALKNATNNIIWTWHIWMTDEPRDIAYGSNRYFLDRNIGAVSAEMVAPWINNYGFVYQWGRKDPFVGGDGENNETTANILSIAKSNTIYNTGAEWKVSQTTMSANFARENPMTFICNSSPSADLLAPVDWLSGTPPALKRWDANKTDNDPCPHGYKVPSRDDLKVLTNANLTNRGNWYWEHAATGGSGYWPKAGMRQGRSYFGGGSQLLSSGTASQGGLCFYWSSTTVEISGVPPGGSHRVYIANSLYDLEWGDNADAYPVRCVKE